MLNPLPVRRMRSYFMHQYTDTLIYKDTNSLAITIPLGYYN